MKQKPDYDEWCGECEPMDEMMEMDEMPMMKKKMCMETMEEYCEPKTGMPDMVLAHAYVPWQFYDKAFSPREALAKGTLFPSLWGVYPIPE